MNNIESKLDRMRYAGKVNVGAIEWGFHIAKPGVTLLEIDAAVEWYIVSAGCRPAFKGYHPLGYLSAYPATACLSVNDVAVHGLPNDYVLKDGDLLTIDVGTKYKGYNVDAARSRVIGKPNEKAQKLVDAVNAVMDAQLSVIKDHCSFLQLIEAAEATAQTWGVTIMPQWGGHKIGTEIHQDPFVPNAIDRTLSPIKQNLERSKYSRTFFEEGQTFCIEPVTTFGNQGTIVDRDGWSIRQADGELVAHTERCLVVTKNGFELLS